jgi:hypothetical protein
MTFTWGEIGVGSGEVLWHVRRRGGIAPSRWLVSGWVLDKSAETGNLGFWSGYSFENAHSKNEELTGFVVD